MGTSFPEEGEQGYLYLLHKYVHEEPINGSVRASLLGSARAPITIRILYEASIFWRPWSVWVKQPSRSSQHDDGTSSSTSVHVRLAHTSSSCNHQITSTWSLQLLLGSCGRSSAACKQLLRVVPMAACPVPAAPRLDPKHPHHLQCLAG